MHGRYRCVWRRIGASWRRVRVRARARDARTNIRPSGPGHGTNRTHTQFTAMTCAYSIFWHRYRSVTKSGRSNGCSSIAVDVQRCEPSNIRSTEHPFDLPRLTCMFDTRHIHDSVVLVRFDGWAGRVGPESSRGNHGRVGSSWPSRFRLTIQWRVTPQSCLLAPCRDGVYVGQAVANGGVW